MKLLLGFFKLLNFGLAAATLLAYLAPLVSPVDFWPLVFFGLAYPAFLVGNLLFILFWFFVKKRLIWISAITLLIGINHIPKIIGFNFFKSENTESTKILSLNAANFFQFGKKGKLKQKGIKHFYSFLEKEDFEVACFQEFSPYQARQSDIKNPAFFKNNGNQNPQILIGSNNKINASGKFDFGKLKTNGISWADIILEEKTVRVYSFHLKSNQISGITNNFAFRENFFSKRGIGYLKKVLPRYKRAATQRVEMVKKLTEHMEACPYPIILCGDMNEPPVSYIHREITKNFKDAFVEKGFGWGKTYNGKIPGLRIDYIFVSPEIEVVDFKILKNDFSDHFPVICNLKLSEG